MFTESIHPRFSAPRTYNHDPKCPRTFQVKDDTNRAKKASKKNKNEILGSAAIAAMQKLLAKKNKELLHMKECLDEHMKKPKVKAEINVRAHAHI